MPRTVLWLCLLLGVCLTGCVTQPKVDWQKRVGSFTYDQAVVELGPPDKSAKLKDGSIIAEWLTMRGYAHSTYLPMPGLGVHSVDTQTAPDQFLRLTFDGAGILREWRYLFR